MTSVNLRNLNTYHVTGKPQLYDKLALGLEATQLNKANAELLIQTAVEELKYVVQKVSNRNFLLTLLNIGGRRDRQKVEVGLLETLEKWSFDRDKNGQELEKILMKFIVDTTECRQSINGQSYATSECVIQALQHKNSICHPQPEIQSTIPPIQDMTKRRDIKVPAAMQATRSKLDSELYKKYKEACSDHLLKVKKQYPHYFVEIPNTIIQHGKKGIVYLEGFGHTMTADEKEICYGNYRFNGCMNGLGTKRYNNNDYAQGQFAVVRNNQPELNGIGSYYHHTGRVERGRFLNNVLVGNGYRIYPDGLIEEGQFQDGWLVNGRKTRPDASFEEGQFQDGLLVNGYSKHSDGHIYEGRFVQAQLVNGRRTSPNGQIEEGQFVNNAFVNGEKTWPEGVWASGVFENGNVVKGEKRWKNGGIDKGTFVDGQLNGKNCHRTWPNRETLQGEFANGMIVNGHGTIPYTNGDIVIGKFKNGNFVKGTKKWKNGGIDKGKFVDALLHGENCHRTWPNRETLQGEFANGMIVNGHGTVTYTNGDIVIGKFENGNFVKGTKKWNNGGIDKGKFVDDLLHGENCHRTWPNRETLQGEFANGMIVNGNGTVPYTNGDIARGKFENGNFVKGTKKWNNGTVDSGTFENDELHGEGHRIHPDGREESGEFEHGEFKG